MLTYYLNYKTTIFIYHLELFLLLSEIYSSFISINIDACIVYFTINHNNKYTLNLTNSIDLIILGVLTLLSYSIYIYLPGHILMLGHIAETLYSWTIGLSNNITSSFQKIVQKIPTKEL